MAAGRSWIGVAAVIAVVVGGLTLPATRAMAGVSAPGGLTPDDGTSGPLRKNLELSWSPVSGAVGYDVQVAEDDEFGGSVLTESTTLTHWTPPTQLPRGGYVWRVRAKASDGVGPWSQVGGFTRGWDRTQQPGDPALVTSGGTYQYGSGALTLPTAELPAFTWTPIFGASFYEVEISNQPFDSSYPPYSGTHDDYRFTCYTQHTWFSPYGVVAGESKAPGDEGSCAIGMSAEAAPDDGTIGDKFFAGVTYYWRVRGRDGTQDTRTTPFADPALSCTGVWPSAGGTPAGGTGSTTPTPTPTGIPTTSPTPTPPASDVGGIIVKIPSTPPAYLATPECSQWTEGRPFQVLPAAAPEVKLPASGLSAQPTAGDPAATTVSVTGTPVLKWARVAGAAKYRVFLSRTTDFTDSDIVYETHATSLSPAASLADRSVPTYWTVQACGGLRCGPAAPAHAFVKRGWNGVRPLALQRGGTETVLTWSTQWTATRPGSSPVPYDDQAASYQVQVDTIDGGFSKPLVDAKVDQLGSTRDTTYLRLATASLPDYFVWRVRALDETGGGWPWQYSSAWGRIVTASGFGLGSPLTVRFTGPVDVPAGGITILDAAGRAVPGRVEQANAVDYTFTPSGSWTAGASYQLALSGVTGTNGISAKAVPGSVRAVTVVDSSSAALRVVSGDYTWTTGTASNAYGHSYLRTNDDPRTATKALVTGWFSGSNVQVLACKTPSSGRMQVYIDGTYTTTLDLYRSYSGCGVVFSRYLGPGTHWVTLRPAGTKNARSSGYWVLFDAVKTS